MRANPDTGALRESDGACARPALTRSWASPPQTVHSGVRACVEHTRTRLPYFSTQLASGRDVATAARATAARLCKIVSEVRPAAPAASAGAAVASVDGDPSPLTNDLLRLGRSRHSLRVIIPEPARGARRPWTMTLPMCGILAAIGLREAPPAVNGEKNARPATAGDGKHRVRIAAMAKRIRHRGPDWSTIEVRDATQRNALRAPNAAERRRAASRAESAEASGGKEAEVSVDFDGLRKSGGLRWAARRRAYAATPAPCTSLTRQQAWPARVSSHAPRPGGAEPTPLACRRPPKARLDHRTAAGSAARAMAPRARSATRGRPFRATGESLWVYRGARRGRGPVSWALGAAARGARFSCTVHRSTQR